MASLRNVMEVCCNTIASSRTAVTLGLHKGMLQAPPALTKSVRQFAKVVEKADEAQTRTGENTWHRMVLHDAPRALGNTFIACMGATVIDGAHGGVAYSDVKKVFLDHHIDLCKDMTKKLCESEGTAIPEENVEPEELERFMNAGKNTVRVYSVIGPPDLVCQPCVPTGSQDQAPETEKQQ